VIGTILASLAALAFIAIGLGALAAPAPSARQYGLGAEGGTLGFVRALGARDVALGAIVAALILTAPRPALAWALGLSALAGAADFTIVARSPGAPRTALAVHGLGTIALIVAAAAVAAG
jgi:hypothetical protein